MKLIIILLTVACLQVNAIGYSQTVSLNVHDAPLEKVFGEVQKQTGYGFMYAQDLLLKARKVTLRLSNAPLEEALKKIFKDQPFTYKIVNTVIIINTKTETAINENSDSKGIIEPAPPVDIKGRVVNEKGEPVAGASIRVKGAKKQGTSTNDQGEFLLTGIEENAILIISAVNIETFEIRLDGRTEIAINAKTKITQAETVTVTVNTGYQQIPKERATGSFEFINNEELNRKVGPDILSRLEGVSNNVLFDRRKLSTTQSTISPSNILIRGLSTLTSIPETVKSPLIIVNNFPYEGDINNINPDDVESITILKDAAAASIWGARAGNGVIVITTKQGRLNQQTRVSFRSSVNVIQKPDWFYYPQMSTSDYINVETFLYGNGFFNADLSNTTARPAVSPVVEILNKRKLGLISASDSASQINALRSLDVRNDLDRYVYQNAIQQQYSLGFTGGGEKNSYAFFAGFDKNPSTLIRDQNQRITIRFDHTYLPIKNLEFRTGIAYTNNTWQNNSLGDYGGSNYTYGNRLIYPYAQFVDANKKHLSIARNYREGYTDTAGGGKLLDWKFRPLDEIDLADNKTTSEDILLSFGARYKVSNSFSADINYQYEQAGSEINRLMGVDTYYSRNLINLFTQIQGSAVTYKIPIGGILDLLNRKLISQAGRAQLNYNHDWAKHSVFAILGGEVDEKKIQSSSHRYYGYNNNTLSVGLVDFTNTYPQYGNRGNAAIPVNSSGLTSGLNRIVSLYTNIAYTYDKRYTVSASARRDGANLFGVSANNKWKPLWSVGGAWDISGENFYHSNRVPYLRFRTTYGYQGNVNNSVSPYTTLLYVSATSSIFNLPYANVNIPANPEIRWENIAQLNMGLDFRAFSSRISGSIEVYRKKANDVIFSQPVESTTGITTVISNSANITGKGLEFSLRSETIKKKFQWTTEFGFTYSAFEVTDYLIPDKGRLAQGFVSTGGLSILAIRNRNPYGIYSFPFAGLDPATGDPQGYLGKQVSKNYVAILNQSIDTADFTYHGSGLPPYFGFLNNIFRYKGFSLTASISYRLGYYFRKNTINYFSLYNSGITHPDFAKRWQKTGDEAVTNIPSMIYPVSNANRDNFYAYSSVNVLKADNIRFQYLRLAYELGKLSFSKLSIQNIQLFLYANNLGIIWLANKEKIDPDYSTGSTYFPPAKNFAAGIKVDL